MQQELIRWKTDAWKSPEMVAGYAGRMHDETGTNRLKNETEVGLCRTYATGRTILDVGVGTGRAAIPLARDGYDVTGVDISVAMLEQCAREGAGLPLRLLPGDVTALPFADERFDTIVSLNVVVHFPHWEAILDEWRRVLAPGGRLIFDVHSRDHVETVAAASGRTYEDVVAHELADHRNFMLRLATRDIFAYARRNRLTVRALAPYAAILGGGNRNYWLDEHALLQPAALERLLSWIGADPNLFALASVIEQKIVAALSPSATGRLMIVLDDRDDPAANDALEARISRIDEIFARGVRPDDLGAIFESDAERVRDELCAQLQRESQRTFLAMLLAGARSHRVLGGLFGLLPADVRTAIERIEAQRVADEQVASLSTGWAAAIPEASRFYRGVDLSETLSYDLSRVRCAAAWFDKESAAR
jgi:SAM-dependent methyltransferase